MIWFLSIFILLNDGTATNIIKTSNVPQYNNEADCNIVGKTMLENMLPDLAGKGKAWYSCSGITLDELKKALVTGQGT